MKEKRNPKDWAKLDIKKETKNKLDLYRVKNKLKTFEDAINKLLKKQK